MDCDAPATFEELREWRAEDGTPMEIAHELGALHGALLDEAAAGCPLLQDKPWSGSCETTSGYVLEGSAVYVGDRDGVEFDLVITATDAATGALPTGSVRSRGASSYDGGEVGGSTGSTRTVWSFEDSGPYALEATGDLQSSRSQMSEDCVSTSLRIFGTIDGCTIDVSDRTYERMEDDGTVAAETFAVDAWMAEVAVYLCGSRVGDLEGRAAFLDEDWREVSRTDVDGDHCAVEDCDCDDADATISPYAPETEADSVDQNCDGEDGGGNWSCTDWEGDCVLGGVTPSDTADTAADTAPPIDTAAPDDSASPDSADTASATPPPTSSDTGCAGCATPATPGAALLLALAALFRRRR